MEVPVILLDNPGFVVIGIALAACTANEFLAWLFVYRRDRYKYIKGQLLAGEKRLEVMRAMPATDKVSDGTTKARKRKEKLTEDQMKAHMQEVNNLKFINMFVTGVLMFGFYQLLTRCYKGVPVAQLPFEPIPLIRLISHRGLPEDSSPRFVSVHTNHLGPKYIYTRPTVIFFCSNDERTCFYLLCQMSMRTLLGKVFNHGLRASLTNISTQSTALGMMQENKLA